MLLEKVKLILILLVLMYVQKTNAQVSVTPGFTATQLATMLAGPGISISNATLNGTCDSTQRGKFFVTSSNIGLDSGIILTSGSAVDAVGVSATPSTSFNAIGDPDLAILTAPSASHDACVLSLDFVPLGDTIKFKYVFGSAEYQIYTCSSFIDAFGFFISGPGITGPFTSSAANIALLPNGCFVGVNTVNGSTSSPCGTVSGACAPPNNSMFYSNLPIGNSTTGIGYNGYTLPMYAVAAVVPCSTYHLKLAVSDASDWILDSGVFLEAGSLSSNNVSVNFSTGLGAGSNFMVEGCDSLVIKVTRNITGASTVTADSVGIIVGGTATMGVDYNSIPNQIIFTNNPNDTVQTFVIYPYQDNISETGEYITINIVRGCNNTIQDSIKLFIKDTATFTLNNINSAVCIGQSVTTSGTSDAGMNFLWSPIIGIANSAALNTTITPPNVGVQTYSITGQYLSCPSITKNFTITTDPIPVVNVTSTYSLCNGASIPISGTVSPTNGLTFSWNPSGNLVNANTLNPTFIGTSSQNIKLTAVTNNAHCTSSNNTPITVYDTAKGYTNITDTLVCNGNAVQLQAYGGLNNYFWYPNTYISCTSCSNPIVNPQVPTLYHVVYLEPHGCQDTSSVRIQIDPPFTLALANMDTTVEVGTPINITAFGAFGYQWSPTQYISATNTGAIVCTPLQDVTYTVVGVDSYFTCPQALSINIKIFENDIWLPNTFTPNGDGFNDKFTLSTHKYIKLQEFRIFNRWGNEVFSAKSIDDGWDGTYKGEKCDIGTYYYFARWCKNNGDVKEAKGEITLLR